MLKSQEPIENANHLLSCLTKNQVKQFYSVQCPISMWLQTSSYLFYSTNDGSHPATKFGLTWL